MQENFKVELEKLAELETELTERRAALRGQALEQVQKLINEFGLTPAELQFADQEVVKTSTRAGRPVPVKYMDKNGNKWTGRGRTPRWLAEYEENGGSRDDFLI